MSHRPAFDRVIDPDIDVVAWPDELERSCIMNDSIDSDDKPRDFVSPKRGAIPTPKSDIEKAKRFVPDAEPGDEQHGDDSPLRKDVDETKRG